MPLTDETYRAITVGTQWSVNKIAIHNAIEQEMERRDTWQGRYYRAEGARSGGLGVSLLTEGAQP